ncbi:subclass B1 metallo-beta-lactamase [Adhaeribacter aerolatus]|nr:subclass B1 metallo-beta-lactamase [Adhaeribacter aerolatus]
MIKYLYLLIFSLGLLACNTGTPTAKSQHYQSAALEIQKVTDHVYRHTSFLNSERFGSVSCNGMVVFNKGEAVIFDAPTDDSAAAELINWVEDKLHCKVKAIIPTHFHSDCLGGLRAFHQRQIPSYAHGLTIEKARFNKEAVPQNGFDTLLTLPVGDKEVYAHFLGEGHTKDNIVGYFPAGRVLFGGCLIKELGAKRGNLVDANVQAWPMTVSRLKEKYPAIKIVVPGHGKPGGTELLDYTIKLFAQNE